MIDNTRSLTPQQAKDNLAAAVLLFHSCPNFDAEARLQWVNLTKELEATAKVLCNLARRAMEDE